MLSGQKLISWETSINNPNHGRARFQHANGFFLDYDINAPRGLSDAARQNYFNVELAKCAIKVRDFDIEAGKAYAKEWIDGIAADRRAGYSAD